MLLAQVVEKVAVDASTRLASDFGLVGILILIIVGSGFLMIRWFQTALKEQRGELLAINAAQRKEHLDAQKEMKDSFLLALKEGREICAKTAREQLESYEKALSSHYDIVKEWRTEAVTESRAVRDMIQMWVNRMAHARITGQDLDEGLDPARGGRKGTKGGGGGSA